MIKAGPGTHLTLNKEQSCISSREPYFFPPFRVISPKRFVAFRCASSATCAYLIVVMGFVWPSNFPTTGSPTPSDTRWEANVCLLYRIRHSRHTLTTDSIDAGDDPKTMQLVLGHSSVQITLDTYTHPAIENLKKPLNRMASRLM